MVGYFLKISYFIRILEIGFVCEGAGVSYKILENVLGVRNLKLKYWNLIFVGMMILLGICIFLLMIGCVRLEFVIFSF